MPFPFSPTDVFETGALLGTGKTQEVRTDSVLTFHLRQAVWEVDKVEYAMIE